MPPSTLAADAGTLRLRRNTMLWALTAMALFLVSTLLGLFLRLFQGNAFPAVEPVWFYSSLTLHAIIMVGAWFLGSMAGVHYLLARYVQPSSTASELAMGGSVAGVVLIAISTLLGKFGVGWYFLFPLPLYPNGVWLPWATAVFFAGLAILAVFWLIWVLDLLRAIARRYSLSVALGWHILRGAKEPEVPPLVLITTVSLVVVTAALVAAALVLLLFLLHWSGRARVDALLMKNLTFLFGHIIVNITLYLGVAILYEMLPAFAGRPWKTSKLVAIAWNAVLLLVLFAYLHHLYMDFAQPRWVQVAGQTASYFLSLPAAAVTIFGVLALIYRSGFRWTMASRLLVCGVLGWVIGGIAAVIDATVAVNSVFHNTLWVPAHFHTYYLMGVVLMVLAFFDHLSRELTRPDTDVRAAGWTLVLLLAGGYGFLAMFYYGGATSVPRRFATYPEETLQGVIQARVAAAFVVVLFGTLAVYLSRVAARCLRAFADCRNAS
ncbi:MAG: hypothetical protein IANPNBLG_00286 [Bryobacteraceae bacterium]|nr:hypothetical protein [Bryobacteraceae bacterium]